MLNFMSTAGYIWQSWNNKKQAWVGQSRLKASPRLQYYCSVWTIDKIVKNYLKNTSLAEQLQQGSEENKGETLYCQNYHHQIGNWLYQFWSVFNSEGSTVLNFDGFWFIILDIQIFKIFQM